MKRKMILSDNPDHHKPYCPTAMPQPRKMILSDNIPSINSDHYHYQPYCPTLLTQCNPDYLGPQPWYTPEEAKKGYCSQTNSVSQSALQHFNKKHRANYELVEALHSKALISDGIWFHCNFKAKDIAVLGEGSSPIKLFFAELKVLPGPDSFAVTSCRILDGVKQVVGCQRCRLIVHPTGGFRKGHCRDEERIRSLRPRPAKRSRNS